PKNFFMQTQPMLSQILKIKARGHDYFIQITGDTPHYGGLSGATASEAISWKKMDAESKTHVTIYGDVTIVAPLLFNKLKNKRRRHKRLYKRREELMEGLIKEVNQD
ncbi:MAG TPA: deoxyhypusine synthase, partial [Candidatus Atribacteria bacterium]|nr:deoxyhypusine synthase [Candidatus Atribacteria bacterium]